MRSEEELKVKVQQVYNKALEERKQDFLCCSHLNCIFNKRHRVKQNGMVGFCSNPDVVGDTKRNIFICNEEKTAQSCPHYRCAHTEESIERDLNVVIENPALCGQEYPKLAVLLWVLQNNSVE